MAWYEEGKGGERSTEQGSQLLVTNTLGYQETNGNNTINSPLHLPSSLLE